MKKICKIIMLPTEEASHLYIQKETGKLHYDEVICEQIKDCGDQHLYLISDEEDVKEGNWYLHPNGDVDCYVGDRITYMGGLEYSSLRKVIATTDTRLLSVEDGMRPTFSVEFIKYYVKAGGIDEVEVEYEVTYPNPVCSCMRSEIYEPHEENCESRICYEGLKLGNDNTVILSQVGPGMTDKLKEYVQNTSIEQLKKDWEETKPWEKVGPTAQEFINTFPKYSRNDVATLASDLLAEFTLANNIKYDAEFFITWVEENL